MYYDPAITPFKTPVLGKRFGRLIVVVEAEPARFPSGQVRRRVLCRCDCGNEKVVHVQSLRNGDCQSCGCFQRECISKRTTRHGMFRTPTYKAWQNMRDRCSRLTREAAHRYVERGIAVCERWERFENFLEDMGEKPSPKHSVDRIDNDKGYSPDNCRWATQREQMRNTSKSIMLEYKGERMSLPDWSDRLGIPYRVLVQRIRKHGWGIERAFTTLVRRR